MIEDVPKDLPPEPQTDEDMAHKKVQEYWRERRRKSIEDLRSKGICIVCGTRKARKERATCQKCSDDATERTRLAREAKKKQ